MSNSKYKALVLDSGAFINHASIYNAADEFYSIEQVMCEVRDKEARGMLERFPYEIKIRSPSKEAVDIVTSFAKSTGDFSRLSQTDLLLIALTYDLQKEVGDINTVIVKPLFDRSKLIDVDEKRIVGINVSSEPCRFYAAGECSKGNSCMYKHPGDMLREEYEEKKNLVNPIVDEKPVTVEKKEIKKWCVPVPEKTSSSLFAASQFPALGSGRKADTECNNSAIKSVFALPIRAMPEEKEEEKEEGEEEEEEEEGVEEVKEPRSPVPNNSSHIQVGANSLVVHGEVEDNDAGWVGANQLGSFNDNLRGLVTSKDSAEEDVERQRFAACCTGDFSMQNVLLQMGFHLLSYDNTRITSLKIFTRRCKDCFAVCNDESRLFCEFCGHNSLAKVPVTICKGGIIRIGQPYQSRSLKGTIYSIGKNDDLLLYEDQLKSGKWKQRVQKMRHAKKEGCLFGDVGAESLGLGSSSQNSMMNSLVVGYGRKNPNAMKGREKRGKKKQKQVSRY